MPHRAPSLPAVRAASMTLDLNQPVSLQSGETVYMAGRTIGLKQAHINQIDIDCKISYPVVGEDKDGKITKETIIIVSTEKACVIAQPKHGQAPFSQPGDSGGPVWNSVGRPARMFFGAHRKRRRDDSPPPSPPWTTRGGPPQVTEWWHYVSPLPEIVEDVKDVLGSAERGRPDVVLI